MAAATDASMAKGEDGNASSKRLQFPTRSFHGAVIALVLSLAVFRFFIQGEAGIGCCCCSGYVTAATQAHARKKRAERSHVGSAVRLEASTARATAGAKEDYRGRTTLCRTHVLTRNLFRDTDADDRHHCKALLNEGRWLDSKHTSWQPEGCMLHPYKPKEVGTCLEGRSVVFIGDSTVRQVFCESAVSSSSFSVSS